MLTIEGPGTKKIQVAGTSTQKAKKLRGSDTVQEFEGEKKEIECG